MFAPTLKSHEKRSFYSAKKPNENSAQWLVFEQIL